MDTSTDSAIDLEGVPTIEEAKKINPINKDAVHRICSGQVVLSLAIAVKELVENSLDSGATNVEVRLKEYGEELVEVLDNGSGVTEDNFAGLTLKYHTSKLRDFSDLLGVSTFGFRGEALSSLCALSDMTITTRHTSVEIGTKLTFDHKGHIVSSTQCARQPGTTVSLSNLFSTLPVRQKDFHRNLKREFNKMTQLLYAYCLVATGVKITCTNQVNKGQKSMVVSTQGGSVKDNIACVFGGKQSHGLMELLPVYPEGCVDNVKEAFYSSLENGKPDVEAVEEDEQRKLPDVTGIISDNELQLSEDSNEPMDPQSTQSSNHNDDLFSSSQQSTCSNNNKTKRDLIKKPFDFEGYVSSCAHGEGRSAKDRQFFYINSRPCEPSKIIKLINEVYKSYNPHQVPFIYMNLKMKRSSVDVNVTPDKRKLFFDKEKILLDVIKTSLNKLYENIPSTLKMENTQSDNVKKMNDSSRSDVRTPRVFTSFLSQFSSKTQQSQTTEKPTVKSIKDSKRKATSSLDNYVSKISKICQESEEIDDDISVKNNLERDDDISDDNIKHRAEDTGDISLNDSFKELICEIQIEDEPTYQVKTEDKPTYQVEIEDESVIEESSKVELKEEVPKEIVYLGFSDHVPLSQVVDIKEIIGPDDEIESSHSPRKMVKHSPAKPKADNNVKKNVIVDTEFERVDTDRKVVKINTSMELITKQMFDNCKVKEENENKLKKVKFRSEIDPMFNKQCEEELRKEISKDMFSEMKIIGQFNLGFIITRLGNDLFIIDQHATDEKYNFETLQKSTVLTNQRLVIPQSLELSGVNERVLMDNLEVFSMNGFTFQIDEGAPPTKRVKLLTIPTSNNYVFGKEDVDELLFMLQDSPNELCRPSRVRSMFASRACRKSVMIGTSLSRGDMKRLVSHMGHIEHPWNCPHGRPTIRHLINLSLLNTPD